MNKNICIILSTVPDKKSANFISKKLLEKKLAACISVIPGLKSFYFWKSILEKTSEVQLIIKTFIKLKKIVFNEIKTMHPYSCPELLTIKIDDVDNEYYSWIKRFLN